MSISSESVAERVLALSASNLVEWNWGLAPVDAADPWDLGGVGYINGVPLILDLDLRWGCLVEVVERGSLALSYLVVVTPGEPSSDIPGDFECYKSRWWPGDAGTLRDPKVGYLKMCEWAVPAIWSLWG